jgi:ABC-type oligopeptide transport system substrate-binding subunit
LKKRWTTGAGLAATAIVLAACGSSSSGGTTSSQGGSTATSGGTLKVLTGTYPDSLDPQFGYTTQAAEADNMVYTPLLDYAFKAGAAGTQLQPALATGLPQVSANGLTYTVQLRQGLTYSDGSKVVASNFTHAIERAIKTPWGGASFFTGYIKGAADYGSGKAKSISGIQTNDSTGKIVIHLTQKYGAFDNVLAFPAASLVPNSAPLKSESSNPPVGIGPYKFSKIVVNNSYVLVKNPSFAGFHIPGIPTGNVNEVDVNVDSNNQTEAQDVLNNTADIFDPGDEVPPSLLGQAKAQTSRYTQEPIASTYYFFFNVKVAPFNKPQVRTAVNMAIDRTALARLSAGALTPACYFLPPSIVGHNSGPCPFGNPSTVPSAATIAKAKQMIASAGEAGAKVTVWSETRQPRQAFMDYYENLLTKLGFKANLKVLADASYFQTIGKQSLFPQTGFADWSQDFPNPSDFYLLVSKAGIQSVNSENFGNVDDPKIESQLPALESTPATQLTSKSTQWQNLDKYLASQSYLAPFGYDTVPKFTSTRVDYATAVFNPVYYMEFNTVSLK